MTETPPLLPPSTAAKPHACVTGAPKSTGPGLARAALVLGMFSIIPVIGFSLALAAIVLAIASLVTRRRGKVTAVVALVLAVVLCTLSHALFVIPFFQRGQEIARLLSCQANLKAIGAAIRMYQETNGDAYPPDLDSLLKNSPTDRLSLRCPSGYRRDRPDYFYLPPKDATADPQVVLMAAELHAFHRKGRVVLYADCHIGFLESGGFEQSLAKPENAAFAKAFRDAGGD